MNEKLNTGNNKQKTFADDLLKKIMPIVLIGIANCPDLHHKCSADIISVKNVNCE